MRIRGRSGHGRFGVLGVIAIALLAPSAQAGVLVYHSPADDGIPATVLPELPDGQSQTLNLYVVDDGGAASQSGTPCDDGDGDEVCGWDLEFRASPGLRFESFQPEAGVVHRLATDRLRANGLAVAAPSSLPRRIGQLTYTRADLRGGTVAVRGAVVGADLTLVQLPATTLAVPEPGAWASAIALAVVILPSRRHRASAASSRN